MDYKGELVIKGDVEKLYKALMPEISNSKKNRSEFTIQKFDGKLKIKIIAKDSVALRATLNNLTKLFTVYEKT
ncbi:hypothetical protein HOC35_04255 [Candidatus Woesearchaeota archaeon]|jgi:tRNA threonylcarbamoyladenosine modification (KEOPS) complex  Pcc1 subunit|nr:hypothetical protein [Candidatus Woesearchaeota archaeon]